VDRLNAEVTRLLQLKETAEQLQNDGVSPAGGTPAELLATISREIELWRRVVNEAGVKAE
jgi:tripartite-type tricarboxylate transporter receptor subunit TctC